MSLSGIWRLVARKLSRLAGGPLAMLRRRAPLLCLTVVLANAGCGQIDQLRNATNNSFDRAEPLGLNLWSPDGTLPQIDLTKPRNLPIYQRSDRDGFTLIWMQHSDDLCSKYKARIIAVSRDSRLLFDIPAIALGTMATIFIPVNTVRGLAGAAAVAAGLGAVTQTDTFGGQVGEVIDSAIDTSRRQQANQIKINLEKFDEKQYSIYSSLRDVTDYHDMCSLSNALTQIRTSLQLTSPDAGASPPANQGSQNSVGLSPEANRPIIERSVGGKALAESKAQAIVDANKALPLPVKNEPALNRLSSAEQALRMSQIKQYQRTLCVVPADGDLGPLGSETRKAIGEYFSADMSSSPLDAKAIEELNFAAKKVPSCLDGSFQNAFEVQRYGVRGGEAEIKRLQMNLNQHLPATAQIPENGKLDRQTRAAIAQVRQHMTLGKGEQVDNHLDIELTPP